MLHVHIAFSGKIPCSLRNMPKITYANVNELYPKIGDVRILASGKIQYPKSREERPWKLEIVNKHIRDFRLTFEDEGHKYYLDNVHYNSEKEGGMSVTTLVHSYFKQFNTANAIKGILSNSRWASDPSYKYYQQYGRDIELSWKKSGAESSQKGTDLHLDIERHQNILPVSNISSEFKQYLAFRKDHPYLVPFRTEHLIFDKENRLTGSIDAVMKDIRDDTYVIVDWKRSKNISRNSYHSEDVGKYPLQDLPNCNFSHYSLQLNIYSSIYRRLYGIFTKAMFLVVCHPCQLRYRKIKVPILTTIVDQLMEERRLGNNPLAE